MGNSQDETLIIWIDEKVDDKKEYKKKLKDYENIKLKTYDEINDGIKYLKDIKYQKTIIILSKEFYPDFIKEIDKCIDVLFIIPKIIIFTDNAQNFCDENKDNKSLHLNDPFYNIGGVVDNINDLTKFVESAINKYNPEFENNKDERIKNEELNYQLISNKNELILPIYYTEHFNILNEKNIEDIKKIKAFNEKIFSENNNIIPLGFLFSQLSDVGNIPLNIITKFLLRGYSTHLSFNQKMNDELLKGNYNDYLPIIQMLYKAVNNCILKSDTSKLYKGIFVEKNKWETLLNKINEKNEENLPLAVLYGSSFFSFYKDDDLIEDFKKRYEKIQKEDEIFLYLILESTNNYMFVKNNVIINKELSYYKDDDEILFFPFSCFEVKSIEKKKEKEYTLTLNYLDKYTKLFSQEETRTFKEVPENDFSKLIFNSNIIIQSIEKPKWFNNPSKSILPIPNLNNKSSTQLELNNINDSRQNNVNNNQEDNIEGSHTRIKINEYMNNPHQYNNNVYDYKIINLQNNMTNQELNFLNVIGGNNNHFNNNNNFNNNYNSNFINNNNLINNNIQNITDTIRMSDNSQSNLEVVKSIDDINLISLVKMMILTCLQQPNIPYNLDDLRNNIEKQLFNSLNLNNQANWYVKITIEQLNNFGNINYDSIIIFQYEDSIQKFFIHVAKLL